MRSTQQVPGTETLMSALSLQLDNATNNTVWCWPLSCPTVTCFCLPLMLRLAIGYRGKNFPGQLTGKLSLAQVSCVARFSIRWATNFKSQCNPTRTGPRVNDVAETCLRSCRPQDGGKEAVEQDTSYSTQGPSQRDHESKCCEN